MFKPVKLIFRFLVNPYLWVTGGTLSIIIAVATILYRRPARGWQIRQAGHEIIAAAFFLSLGILLLLKHFSHQGPVQEEKSLHMRPQAPSFWLYYLFQPYIFGSVWLLFTVPAGYLPSWLKALASLAVFTALFFAGSLLVLPVWYLIYRLAGRWFPLNGKYRFLLPRWLLYAVLGVFPLVLIHPPWVSIGTNFHNKSILLCALSSAIGATSIIVFELIRTVRFSKGSYK